MKKSILFLWICCSALMVTAQTKYKPRTKTITHAIGDDRIHIKVIHYGKQKDIVFINLHSDETTSVDGAETILRSTGGLLIKVENDNKRNISFSLGAQQFTFDPNRIFSRQGIERTLSRFKNVNEDAIGEVEGFAAKILSLFPRKAHSVVALHNNTDGHLSIGSFLPGNVYEKDAQKVFAGKDQDPDDFFLTTDSLLYHQLSAENYNVVLQDNRLVQQDGSLSVYFGEKKTRYLNCETEHGRQKQFEEMLSAALKYIREKKGKS